MSTPSEELFCHHASPASFHQECLVEECPVQECLPSVAGDDATPTGLGSAGRAPGTLVLDG